MRVNLDNYIKFIILTGGNMSERFEDSPEYDDWIQETGGRDEDYSDYYNQWERRKLIESLRKKN